MLRLYIFGPPYYCSLGAFTDQTCFPSVEGEVYRALVDMEERINFMVAFFWP